MLAAFQELGSHFRTNLGIRHTDDHCSPFSISEYLDPQIQTSAIGCRPLSFESQSEPDQPKLVSDPCSANEVIGQIGMLTTAG